MPLGALVSRIEWPYSFLFCFLNFNFLYEVLLIYLLLLMAAFRVLKEIPWYYAKTEVPMDVGRG